MCQYKIRLNYFIQIESILITFAIVRSLADFYTNWTALTQEEDQNVRILKMWKIYSLSAQKITAVYRGAFL